VRAEVDVSRSIKSRILRSRRESRGPSIHSQAGACHYYSTGNLALAIARFDSNHLGRVLVKTGIKILVLRARAVFNNRVYQDRVGPRAGQTEAGELELASVQREGLTAITT
jgi:hypothetical protein